ncbi:MAG: L-threonine 3-dehydrogenase [Gammaproteobacteria bacterium]
MKALVKRHAKEGLWLEEVPMPDIGHNDVLIKVKRTAVCGTDLHIYNWDEWAQKTIPVPMVVGHEFVGEIAEVGADVTELSVGQLVSGEGHITCGICRNCRAGRRHLCRKTIGLGVNRQGCFAEYVSMPAVNVYPIPEGISERVAAMMDPLGNAVHTALSFDLVGEDVLITGAGPIGMMACTIAKYVGARHVVITDVNEGRLALAKKMGATRVVNVQHQHLRDVMDELGMQEGFDVGLEMSGNPLAINSLFDHMNHGGKVALLGIPSTTVQMDLNQIIFKGLIVKGIYGREMFETWYKMVSLLTSGMNVDAVITHEYPYHEFQKAFDEMKAGRTGKVILEW